MRRPLPPRDARGRFAKRPTPLPDELLQQLGVGLVRVGDIVIPVMVCPRIVSTDLDDLWLLAEWH